MPSPKKINIALAISAIAMTALIIGLAYPMLANGHPKQLNTNEYTLRVMGAAVAAYGYEHGTYPESKSAVEAYYSEKLAESGQDWNFDWDYIRPAPNAPANTIIGSTTGENGDRLVIYLDLHTGYIPKNNTAR